MTKAAKDGRVVLESMFMLLLIAIGFYLGAYWILLACACGM